MLRLDHVSYSQGAFSLSADFACKTGSKTAVIGPSGSGKSTLLALIAGFENPDAGRILLNGQDMVGIPPGNRPVSMLFQDNNLFPHLSAFQNVALGLRPSLKLTGKQMQEVKQVLEQVGLAEFQNRRPAQMSGGQQSRVALARALLRQRPLLLLDEPFSALGPALRDEMLALVQRLVQQTNATLLMVTHNPEDARMIADQTIFVLGGQVAPPRPTEALLNDPPRKLAEYLRRH